VLLVLRFSEDQTQVLEVPLGQELVLGRDPHGCHVHILDPGVSHRHCKLSAGGDHVWLEDLGSSNGTFVNGERVTTTLLSPGDEVRIGGCVMVAVQDWPRDELPVSGP
jgi:pSer/pThr/pTyr-binding forkhead associated (FHA) protein